MELFLILSLLIVLGAALWLSEQKPINQPPAEQEKPLPPPEPENDDLDIQLINRFEHTHILGGTGSGKTQLIQFLVARDLREDCTIIVIDNQRQMINKLARLGQDMALISPRYDLALNPFDFPRSNTTINLLKYVLSGLLEGPLTAKQLPVFEFGIQLMLVTPGATLDTFRKLLSAKEPDFTHVNKLDPISQEFFRTEFMNKNYDQTKQEIAWRIWALLKNPTLARMFTAPKNKIDLARELNRRLILIDCDVDTLQEYSGFFGRFFIAQLMQLAQERFVGRHKPVYVYIDEAYTYFDQNIASMLETARKSKIGLILAHQMLSQVNEPKMRDALLSLTSTKFASSLGPSDAHAMAQAMNCTPEFVGGHGKLQFALWQRGKRPQSVIVPAGVIEGYPSYPIPDELMRNRYARNEDDQPPPVTEQTVEIPQPRKPPI